MIRDMLQLTTVQVGRVAITPDGMGGTTTTTTLTTLPFAAIWQAGASNPYLADRVALASSHLLAVETTAYTWAQDDQTVVYGAQNFDIVGRPDDVANQGELTIVGLERIT